MENKLFEKIPYGVTIYNPQSASVYAFECSWDLRETCKFLSVLFHFNRFHRNSLKGKAVP